MPVKKRECFVEIKRDHYLNALISRMHNGLVKVITGIRRCGKSYLLFTLFYQYLLEQGVAEDHIFRIELDRRANRQFRDPDVILKHLESCITDDQSYYYILLDEVQMLEEFEEVLNSLLHVKNVDIYVTGSNAKYLSKDVITEFRGRGDEVHLLPLSFREFMSVYEGDLYHGWSEYVTYGGLPLTLSMKTKEQKAGYLSGLFSEVYLPDLAARYSIAKTRELEALISILSAAVGQLANPARLEGVFQSLAHFSLSGMTIRQYIGYLEEAYLISSAHRYDVKARKLLGTPVKYYFEDVGLRNARRKFRQGEDAKIMENIVYNELRCRGYQVDVGVVDIRPRTEDGTQLRRKLEIDFVANQGSRRYYIQSAFSPDEEKIRLEKAALLRVRDSFKKIILVKDVMNVQRDEDGIVTMSIYDFLLQENSLEL